jgi:hypothetical protein
MILRHKRVWIPAVTTVLIVGGVLLANQLVRSSAETKIAKTVACGLKSSGPTKAHLTDPWAGLGVFGGDLGTVDVSAKKVQLGDTSVDLMATITHVKTGGTSGAGTASATVAYSEVQKQLGGDMQVRGDGKQLVIDTTFGVAVTVHASLATTGQAVTVTPTDISTLGQTLSIPELLKSPLGKALPKSQLAPRTIPLPGLPTGTSLTGATPAADGLRLAFALAPTTTVPDCAA